MGSLLVWPTLTGVLRTVRGIQRFVGSVFHLAGDMTNVVCLNAKASCPVSSEKKTILIASQRRKGNDPINTGLEYQNIVVAN